MTLLNQFENLNQEEREKEVQERAKSFGFAYADFAKTKLQKEALKIIPKKKSKELGLICFFAVQKKIRVAVLDEKNEETRRYLEKLKSDGYSLNLNLISKESFEIGLASYQELKEEKVLDEKISLGKKTETRENGEEKDFFEKQEILKEIYSSALRTGASDLHFEPFESYALVRVRVDGKMKVERKLDKKLYKEVLRLVKHKAKLTLNKEDIFQDGQYYLETESEKIDLRVSILPTGYGESVVVRILNPDKAKIELEKLGFLNFQKDVIEKHLAKNSGFVLVTGPTGSGKTSSLYSCINKLNTQDRKIVTLEDPVEYHFDGVVQSQISKNLSFSEGLKSTLRQDPDVILLGEIRDKESAQTALQSSITGHLVLSTLHTNKAVEAIFRLRNLEVKDYLISASLSLVVGQRLVRKLCPHCKKEEKISEKTFEILKGLNLKLGIKVEEIEKEYKKGSCEKCNGTGYSGRELVAEVLEVDQELREKITNKISVTEIEKRLKEKAFLSMKEVAAAKAIKGITSFEEVFALV